MAMSQNGQWGSENGMGPMFGGGGSGFDTMSGGFPGMGNMNNVGNMGFNGIGDYSQMMNFIPNGMPNNMMNPFSNVMGMFVSLLELHIDY